MSEPERALRELLELMARLRDPQRGCPWDREQTFASIAPYTIEEAYEVADAIERDDREQLRDELGDLLFQVVFHARMAEERGWFDFAAVARAIYDKLVRRHPHVFGDVTVSGADEVKRNWDEIKREERRARAERQAGPEAGLAAPSVPSALDGVPFAQPALSLAAQLQRRAARAGVPEELARLDGDPESGEPADGEEDIGRELFRIVARAREAGRDPEMELRASARRYRDLVRAWERS